MQLLWDIRRLFGKTHRRRGSRVRAIPVERLERRCLPTTFTVLNTLDSGAGSLRQAIQDANATGNTDSTGDGQADPDVIAFNIPANDPGHVYYRDDGVAGQIDLANVALTSALEDSTLADRDPDWSHSWWRFAVAFGGLPAITGAVILDGYSQSGALANANSVDSLLGLNTVLRVELMGPGVVGDFANGLRINANGTTVRGLAINQFQSTLIRWDASDGTIAGNFVGTEISGTLNRTLARGIDIGQANIGNNLVGGTASASRNLIVASTDISNANNRVEGNLIGTDRTGTRGLSNNNGVGIRGTNNLIGGTDVNARNIISGNGGLGIDIRGSDHKVQGNFIGTDVTGTVAVRNGSGGVTLGGTNNTVGGIEAGARNVISGNRSGVGFGNTGNILQGNFIGTAADGISPLGNEEIGIVVGSSNHLIGGTEPGAGNVIAYNGLLGLYLAGGPTGVRIQSNTIFGNAGSGVFVESGTNNPILSNSIFGNGGLGIDLGANNSFSQFGNVTPNDLGDADGAANNLQNFPVLTAANLVGATTTVTGTLNSTANRTFRLEFFANAASDATGFGEGQTFLGFVEVTTDANGDASFSAVVAPLQGSQPIVTATATDLTTNDTSEFSAAIGGQNANNPPNAQDDAPPSIFEDSGSHTFDVRANDTFAPDADETLTITAITQPANGTVAIVGSGSGVSYSPASNFFGSDIFTYSISDGRGGSDTATVTVTVLKNDPPVANADNVTIIEDTATLISFASLLENDTDPDGDALSVTAIDFNQLVAGSQFFTGNDGRITINDDGTLTYQSAPNQSGENIDNFNYSISDGKGATAFGIVFIHATPGVDASFSIAAVDSNKLEGQTATTLFIPRTA